MLPKRNFCILLLFLFNQNHLFAQDKLNIKFGKVTVEDFNIKSPLIDSGTNAVVIADVGKSEFVANTSDLTFSLMYTEKKRIKVISKNGFEAATIIIPLYVQDSKAEKLEQLKASTYNIENGQVVETKVDKGSVFTENHSKNWIYKKFTFPALKEGSIIEYSYQIKSDFFFNLQSWIFQGEYPVLWSQYDAAIPEFFKYVVLSQGYQPLYVNKTDHSVQSFNFIEHADAGSEFTNDQGQSSRTNSFKIDGSIDYHTWVMKDVPALKEEAFTTTLSNAIAKIEFQLNQIAYPNSIPHNYMNTWEKVASDLMADDQFGGAINRPNNWLDKDVNDAVNGSVNQKEKAQKIFEYVRDNFTYNDNNRMYVTTGLKDVFKNKGGSAADINMLLIAMLKTQNIEAYPVILSTRDHGFTHELYPLMDRYNYLIAQVVIDNNIFYLDATSPKIGFGMLPSKVYNGQARVITKDAAMPVYFVADSLKESNFSSVFLTNLDNGTFAGSITHDFGTYASLGIRKKLATTTLDDYKKSLEKELPDGIAIDSLAFDSLKLLNTPVSEKLDIRFKSFGDDDIIYFNPMLDGAIKKNPFTAAERYYPVEMPFTVNNVYTLNMEIPKGFAVEELPKSVKFSLNNDDGIFEYLISADKEYIQMRCRLVLNRANFMNDDYQYLRELYTAIVKKESEQIVFKKVK
ncbi:MAG TPA: transglutaminase domain-containing protein [Ginsengibacter sp.]